MEAVPSVMESPKQATTTLSAEAITSKASRKYQDVVVKGKPASVSSRPRLPARGPVRYEVVSAFACHVIGPLGPTT